MIENEPREIFSKNLKFLFFNKMLYTILKFYLEVIMFHRKKVNNILRKARRIDKKYEIFGVSRHHYKLNCPVNKEFVHKVEEKYHFILPKDYAQFITEVGDGGAGPDYGIYPFGNFIKIYIPVAIIFIYIIGLSIEYFMKQRFYKDLEDTLNNLDDKYLISEIIKVPSFMEGKILKDLLEQINKSMVENVNKYKYMGEEYKDFIELWIHEIKIPIAASKMIIENNKNEVTKSIDEELRKIENYTEQALFYARSNTVEKDYYIKKTKLKDIVNESIKKNRSSNKINTFKTLPINKN